MKNVIAVHAFIPADDIGGCVSLRMTHMKAFPGGVWEHVEDIILGLCGIKPLLSRAWGPEGLFLRPMVLPALLKLVKGKSSIFFGHDLGEREAILRSVGTQKKGLKEVLKAI
jgi:hypothetical protein